MPKVVVTDGSGRRWMVKFGEEAKAETGIVAGGAGETLLEDIGRAIGAALGTLAGLTGKSRT